MLRALIGSISSLLMGTAAQAVAFVLLARYLGVTQFGHLMTITAVAALANTWCGLGSAEMLRRIVTRDPSMYSAALGHTLLLILLTGLALTTFIVPGMMLFVPAGVDRNEYLQIILLIVPTSVVAPSYVGLVESIFLARGDFRRANFVNGGFGVLRAVTAVVACIFFGVATLRSWAVWWAGSHLCMCVLCLVATWRFGAPRWRLLRKEFWLGWNLALSGFLIMLRSNVDVLVLSAVATPEFLGIYGAGRRLIGAALVVPGAFDRVIYGKLAIAGKHGPSASLKLARKYLVYSIAISGATSAALFVAAPYAPLIFGPTYSAASDVIRILSWTVVSTAVQFLAFDALNAADQHKLSALTSGIANIVGACMVVIFGRAYGTLGIYVSLYLSDIARGAALWFVLHVVSSRQARAAQPAAVAG
jgi:O-antigen/teichoic acid export membrane protein